MPDISKHNPFSAPIPGESLTRPKGGSPWERPAQFADKDEAAEYLFTELTKPKKAQKLVALLQTGASAEMLAKGVIFKGFQDGKWTPDVGIMLSRIAMGMILSIGKKAGLSDDEITIHNPNLIKQDMDFFKRVDEKTNGKLTEKAGQRSKSMVQSIQESTTNASPMNLMEKL